MFASWPSTFDSKPFRIPRVSSFRFSSLGVGQLCIEFSVIIGFKYVQLSKIHPGIFQHVLFHQILSCQFQDLITNKIKSLMSFNKKQYYQGAQHGVPNGQQDYIIRDGRLSFKPSHGQALSKGELHIQFDQMKSQMPLGLKRQGSQGIQTKKVSEFSPLKAAKRRSPDRPNEGYAGNNVHFNNMNQSSNRQMYATPKKRSNPNQSSFMRSRGSQVNGQSQPILQPLSLSPSRVIKIMFNQVSKENPFAAVENVDTPGNSNNVSGFGSDDSLERGDERLESTPGYATAQYHGRTPYEQDKIINTTPAGRILKDPNARSGQKLFSGVQRFSDNLQPYNALKEQQDEVRENVRHGSPFKGMTDFQSVLMARSNSPQKGQKQLLIQQNPSRSRSNSKETRNKGSPGRRGQAPTQLKRAQQVQPQSSTSPVRDDDQQLNRTIDHAIGPSKQFFPDLTENEDERTKNRLKNQMTSVDFGHYDEPIKTPRQRKKNWQRATHHYGQKFNSQHEGNLQVKDGAPDDLNGTAILNRSRSRSRSKSNKRLHCDCEDPAGVKTNFRKMIEANLPDDSVWHQHAPQPEQYPVVSKFRGGSPYSRSGQRSPKKVPAIQGFPQVTQFGQGVVQQPDAQSYAGDNDVSVDYSQKQFRINEPPRAPIPEPVEHPLYKDTITPARASFPIHWPSSKPNARFQTDQPEDILRARKLDTFGTPQHQPNPSIAVQVNAQDSNSPFLLGLNQKQSTANFPTSQVPRLFMQNQQTPQQSVIEQAISESLDTDNNNDPLDLPLPTKVHSDLKAEPAKQKNHVYRVLQEPIYGKVSNQVLKDFNKQSIGALEDKYRLSAKNFEVNVSQEMLTAFRHNPKHNFNNRTPWQGDELKNFAAVLIQKSVRGYLVRRNAPSIRGHLQFRRLLEKADDRSKQVTVQKLIRALRLAHQGLKEKKQALLNGYITYCAVKIQQTWRGYYDRRYMVPFMQQLGGPKGYHKLNAVIVAWRVRRIMALRDVKGRAQLIIDHDGARQLTDLSEAELRESRRNLVKKFISYIASMQINGQWLILLKSHKHPRVSKGYKIPNNQEEEDKMLQTISHQKRFGDGARRGKQSRIRPSQITNSQKSARETQTDSSHPRAFINISASNRFEPNFHSSEYKAAAKQIFNRRMQYDPNKSIQETRSSHNLNSQQRSVGRTNDSFLGSAVDNQKMAVHDLLLNQRTRAKTMRHDASQNTYQARMSNLNSGASLMKLSNRENPYKNKIFKPTEPAPFKVKDVDQNAQESLKRRQNYIPDLRKRQYVKATTVTNPLDFLEQYKQRKELRQQIPDRVDMNKNLSVEHADIRNNLAKNIKRVDRPHANPYTQALKMASPTTAPTTVNNTAIHNDTTLQSINISTTEMRIRQPPSAISVTTTTTNQYLQRYQRSPVQDSKPIKTTPIVSANSHRYARREESQPKVEELKRSERKPSREKRNQYFNQQVTDKSQRSQVASEGATAPMLNSIKLQMRRSQQKQDELLQQMLDKPSNATSGSDQQQRKDKPSTYQNKYLRATYDRKTSQEKNADLPMKTYSQSEIHEISMFTPMNDLKDRRDRNTRQRQVQNPYLKPMSSSNQNEVETDDVNGPAEKTNGRNSEQSDISLVNDNGDNDARTRQPQTLKSNIRSRIQRNRRLRQDDTFGTYNREDDDRDEGSIGASSGGIRPYSKSKSSRKGSISNPKTVAEPRQTINNSAQQILDTRNIDDEDTFALEVHRIPGSSVKTMKTFTATSKSISESKR